MQHGYRQPQAEERRRARPHPASAPPVGAGAAGSAAQGYDRGQQQRRDKQAHPLLPGSQDHEQPRRRQNDPQLLVHLCLRRLQAGGGVLRRLRHRGFLRQRAAGRTRLQMRAHRAAGLLACQPLQIQRKKVAYDLTGQFHCRSSFCSRSRARKKVTRAQFSLFPMISPISRNASPPVRRSSATSR